MAKYRCPSCGASHKDQPHQCRLCGAIMDGTVDQRSPVAVQSRPIIEKKKGMGSLAMVGLVAVAVIVVLAVALGFTSGDLSTASLRDKIPFLRVTNDGWVKVDDPEGGFTVEMPSSRQTGSAKFPPAANGQLTGWVADIGPETSLAVLYGKLDSTEGETSTATLNRVVDADIAQSQAEADAAGRVLTVGKRTETNFRGYPAVVYDVSGVTQDDQYGYNKNLVFLKGDELYVIGESTIYKDYPHFDRLVNSFQFSA
jgi:hypothetical protein